MNARPAMPFEPDLDFQPSRVLRVYGMRRSGNHAILDGFLRNAPGGNAVFFNNCKKARDPIRTHRSLELRRDGQVIRAKGPLNAALSQVGQGPLAIVSVEDAMPRPAERPLWGGEEQTVLIYRGFLNWSASLLKKIKGNASYGTVERTRIMTTACRTYGRALKLASDPGAMVPVLYDRWIASEPYRAQTLEALGLETRDLGLGDVQRYGGGSSFQPDTRDAASLGTDRRADQLADDPEFGILLWLVAHDLELAESIAEHFPQDAERILRLAETAGLSIHLPGRTS
ncbi:MAG: hypothetical protein CML68_23455 [Rhodobacteraceae bacterium]|nr:hypothetical protein [Paracoccaceae bacterium]